MKDSRESRIRNSREGKTSRKWIMIDSNNEEEYTEDLLVIK